ncbi:MAG: hypothetical protein D6702_04755 [Planctomycetota bacterium]|nr:MAG: hypothetical protein D6702_04755 [Planctomycetota bacterium]
MSPLASILLAALSPWTVLPGLLVGWWAVWFTLGRNFTLTSLMTLAAQAASLLLAGGTLASGALAEPAIGDGHPVPAVRLAAAASIWFAALLVLEAHLLRAFMRRLRPGWSWDPFDLLTYGAARVPAVALAAWLVA